MKWVLAARQLGNFYDRKDCFHWVQNALLRWWVGFRPWRYSPSLLHYVQFTKKELSLNHLCSRKMFQFLNASLNFLGLDTEYSLSKPKKLRTVSYEWELNTAEFWNLFLLQVNLTGYFYLLVSNGNWNGPTWLPIIQSSAVIHLLSLKNTSYLVLMMWI